MLLWNFHCTIRPAMPDFSVNLICLYLSPRGPCAKGSIIHQDFPKNIPYPSASLEAVLLPWGFLCNPPFACFIQEHLRLPRCSGCASFGNKVLFNFLPSLIPSFCNWKAVKKSSLELSLVFQHTGKLVFVDHNKQISILGWADRKGGFIFSLF